MKHPLTALVGFPKYADVTGKALSTMAASRWFTNIVLWQTGAATHGGPPLQATGLSNKYY